MTTLIQKAVDSLVVNIAKANKRAERTGKAKDRAAAAKMAATLEAIDDIDLDLASYDFWAISSSAGKDSQAALDVMVQAADAIDYPRDQIVVIYIDLGRAAWSGSRELAKRQMATYELRFVVTKARTIDGRERNLLEQIEERGMWPSNSARYCTSDQKRGPCRRMNTELAKSHPDYLKRPIRILSVLGIRAEESPSRLKVSPIMPAYINGKSRAGSSGRKHIVTLFPIYEWAKAEVWANIRASGVEHHRAYDLGMPRLSCVFCVFAPKAALLLAGKHNPELLVEYVEAEKRMGHTFRHKLSIASIKAELDAGVEANLDDLVDIGGAWNM